MAGHAVSDLVRRAAVPVLCLMVSAYFLHHAVMGPKGILALADIRARGDVLAAERQALEAERARLQAEIALLDPRGADPDYAEELVRRHLGVARPDELIVPLPEIGVDAPDGPDGGEAAGAGGDARGDAGEGGDARGGRPAAR